MLPELEKCIETFNKCTHEAERFCFFSRAVELQQQAVTQLELFIAETVALKQQFSHRNLEDEANFVLGIVSIAEALKSELSMFLSLKLDDPDSAWSYLIAAQINASKAIKAHDSFEYLENYLIKLDAQEKVFFPPQTFFSPGFIVRKSKCSICSAEYEQCDHIKGRPYRGELCIRIIEKAELLEVSMVKEPANKNARMHSFSSEGVKRDVMTWRILETNVDKKQESDMQDKLSEVLILPSGNLAIAQDLTYFSPEAISTIEPWLQRVRPIEDK